MQQMMMQKNPGMQQALSYIQQHGNDPKTAFESLAKEKGLDPEEIMNLLK